MSCRHAAVGNKQKAKSNSPHRAAQHLPIVKEGGWLAALAWEKRRGVAHEQKKRRYNTLAFTEDHSVHYYRGLYKLNYEDLMGFGALLQI